jgi:DNA-binding NarL/FixJ family response regulator
VRGERAAAIPDGPETGLCRDARPAEHVSLIDLWRDFCGGRWSVVNDGVTADSCFVWLAERERTQRAPLLPRSVDVLTRLSLGQAQKVIAIDLGLASSSISVLAQRAIEPFGVKNRLPLVLTIAAHAAASVTTLTAGVVSRASSADQQITVIQTKRPDQYLSVGLTSAQRSVVRLAFEGYSTARIARARSTSERTVSNQIANIFRVFHVQSRAELVSKLIRDFTPDYPRSGYSSDDLELAAHGLRENLVTPPELGRNDEKEGEQLRRIERKLDRLLAILEHQRQAS